MIIQKIDISIINNLYYDYYNFKKYFELEKKISTNINGRICHHGVVILNILVNLFDINSYLEIGTHNGASMSYVVHQNKKPIDCYGVDLFESTTGHYKKDHLSFRNTFANIKKNNTSNSSISLIKGNSFNIETIDKLRTLLSDKKIDLLFIDGDHSYNGVKSDFENYSQFLSDKAIIVFDDYNKRWPGVIAFCDELLIKQNSLNKIGVFNNNEYIIIK